MGAVWMQGLGKKSQNSTEDFADAQAETGGARRRLGVPIKRGARRLQETGE